jgi:dolichol-phosphate mannosyltransferase
MDGDLQDPPDFVPQLLAAWVAGADVAYALRRKRKEGILKRAAFSSFYRILRQLADTPVPLDAGVFSIVDVRVADALRAMPERRRYLTGLRAWVGFRQVGIPCERGRRYSGDPRQSLGRLMHLALDGLFSFSYVPLRLATLIGLVVSVASFAAGMNSLYQKLFTDRAILGWASILTATTFLGGLNLIVLGIIGEYIGRIYDEAKQRPRYLIRRTLGI